MTAFCEFPGRYGCHLRPELIIRGSLEEMSPLPGDLQMEVRRKLHSHTQLSSYILKAAVQITDSH